MGTKHRDFGTLNGATEGDAEDRTSDLHQPGFIASTDPASTYGTSDASKPPGVQAGQLWIEESSTDTPDALKYRNAANDGWVSLLTDPIPSLTQGDLLFADGSDSLATLGIGSARQLLQVNAGATAPEWASNIDIPGTLDVTGAVTLDSTVDMPGLVTVGDGSTFAELFLDGAGGTPRRYRVRTNGTDRWRIGGSNLAESGSNTGTDFEIISRADDGSGLRVNLQIKRDTGKWNIDGAIENTGAATLDTGAAGSSFGGDLTVSGALSIGSTVASSGALRLEHGAQVRTRNSGNTADAIALTVAADSLQIGPSTNYSNVRIAASTLDTFVLGNLRIGDTTAPSKALEVSGDALVTGDLTVSGTGPHAIGMSTDSAVALGLGGAFTVGGGATGAGVRFEHTLTNNTGGTSYIAAVDIFQQDGSITTQGNSETIADVASVIIGEPTITLGTGDTITNASTLKIVSAPTEGTNNYALWVDAGISRFDGDGTHVFELPADATDPTGGGGAATGRIPVDIGGVTRYIAYY